MTYTRILGHSASVLIVALAAVAQGQTPLPSTAPYSTEAAAGQAPAEIADAEKEMQQFWNLMSPVVTTATKDSRHIEEAPSVIMVLTRQEMRNWGYDTLAEAFQHILGFYMVDDHVLPNIAVRGISGGYHAESGVVKVLMNGAPVSFRSTGGNWFGAQLTPLSAIERIEIIRGPASALYGADAFLGVVNIITRTPDQDMADVSVGGNWRQTNGTVGYDLDAAANGHFNKLDTFVAVRLQAENRSGLLMPGTSPAPTLPPYASGRSAARTDVMPSRSGILQLHYKFSPETKLSVTGYLSYMERTDEFAGLVQLANGIDPQGRPSGNVTELLQGFANARFTAKLSDALNVNAVATYFFGGPRADNRLEVISDFFYVRRDFAFGGLDAAAEAQWTVHPKITLTGGLNFIYENEKLLSNLGIAKVSIPGNSAGDTLPYFSQLQGSKTIYNPAAYLQGLWTVSPRYLTVLAGVRYDYHTIYAGQPSARLGLVSEPFDKLYLKLLYGSAFKAPSPLLLYGVPARAGDISGNAALLPQRINTIEFEATRHFLDFILVSTGLVYNALSNQAEFTQTGAYELAANLASVNSLSWETRARLLRPDDFEAYASFEYNYTLLKNNDVGYKGALGALAGSTYPVLQLHAGIIKWVPQWFLRGMLDVTVISGRSATDSNILASGKAYQLPPYVDLGAGLASTGAINLGGKPTTLSVVARNLLGESAGDPGYAGVDYPRLPRSLFFYINQEL